MDVGNAIRGMRVVEVTSTYGTIPVTEQPGRGIVVSRLDGLFFFSSRRRHTRFDCDWSSDVCSSDLLDIRARAGMAAIEEQRARPDVDGFLVTGGEVMIEAGEQELLDLRFAIRVQIGRASCRERV